MFNPKPSDFLRSTSATVAAIALVLIFISLLLAIGIGPTVDRVEFRMAVPRWHWRAPRWTAILIVYIALLGVLTIVGVLVVPPLVTQGQELWTSLPTLIDRAQSNLLDYGLITQRVTLAEAVRTGPASPGQAVGTVGTVATALARVVGSIIALVTVLFLTFYLLVERDSMTAALARLFQREERPRVEEVSRKISRKVSAWLNGQLILAGAIAVTSAAGLYSLRVPYFWVLALLAGIGEMIPVVGPMLSAVPATIAGLIVSPQTGLFVLLFWIAQQQLESQVLVPRVMQRQVGVSPVIVIVALLIGGALLGILGALLAVPTAAILQVFVQELLDERDRCEAREGVGRNFSGRGSA